MKISTRALLSIGVNVSIAYRWADGFVQTAFFRPDGLREHFAWLEDNSNLARPIRVRNLATGRFAPFPK